MIRIFYFFQLIFQQIPRLWKLSQWVKTKQWTQIQYFGTDKESSYKLYTDGHERLVNWISRQDKRRY